MAVRLTMCAHARLGDLLHLDDRDIISQCSGFFAALDGLSDGGGHELDVYSNPVDELEVGIESGKEGSLFVEFCAGAGRDAVEGVGDGEDVEIEAAGCDADGFVLAAEGEESVIHGVVMGVCGAEVGGCELRWTERGRRCDAIWVGVGGRKRMICGDINAYLLLGVAGEVLP